jgi:signal peptidase II
VSAGDRGRPKKNGRARRWGVVAAALVVVADQAVKWWVLVGIMAPPRTIPVTPFFNLVLTWNRGISFGLLNSQQAWNAWLLPVIAVVIVVVLAFWLSRAESRPLALAFGMVIGGAIGNVVDRLRFDGAVMDFLDLHLFGYHWPAFNVADAAISLGAVALVLQSLFGRAKTH